MVHKAFVSQKGFKVHHAQTLKSQWPFEDGRMATGFGLTDEESGTLTGCIIHKPP